MLSVFVVPEGIEKMWIIGDDTVNRSVRGHLNADSAPFITRNFETSIIAGSTASQNGSVIGRICNSLTTSFNNKQYLPKWIVIIVENDVINGLPYHQSGCSEIYGQIIEYMMSKFTSTVATIQRNYPPKAMKFTWPHFLWIEPSINTNHQDTTLRMKFIRSLHAVSMSHNNMLVLPLKQGWDTNNPEYFLWHQQRITPKGLRALWSAIDNTIRFADTKLMRNHGLFLHNAFQKSRIALEMNGRLSNYERSTLLRRPPFRQLQNQQRNPQVHQVGQIPRGPLQNRINNRNQDNRVRRQLFNKHKRQ